MMGECLDGIKADFGIESLPGKDKPLLPGFSVENLNRYFFAIKAAQILKHEDRWVHSRFSLLDDKFVQIAKLDLLVAQKNCDDVYEALFLSYGFSGKPSALKPENNEKNRIGDLCLVPDSKLPPRRIDFVRNNVAIKISNTKQGNQDVLALAREIDAILQKESGFGTLEESQQLPLINNFEIENNNLKFSDKAFFKIDVQNPEKGKLNYLFDISMGSINMVAEDKNEYYYRVGYEPGRFEITLNVINQRSLLSRKSLFVNIESQ